MTASSILLRTPQVGFVVAMAIAAQLPEPLKSRFATRGPAHELAHIAAFLVAFLLLSIGSSSPRQTRFCVLGLSFFAVLLEISQVLRYGNRLEFKDIVDNGLGVALGFLCRQTVWWIRPRRYL